MAQLSASAAHRRLVGVPPTQLADRKPVAFSWPVSVAPVPGKEAALFHFDKLFSHFKIGRTIGLYAMGPGPAASQI